MTIQQNLQAASPGTFIALYEIDLSFLGEGKFRFTESQYTDRAVMWNGFEFKRTDVVAEGFEWTGNGSPPTPTLSISNIGNPVFTAAVLSHDDLLGAPVLRIRTFKEYLDGEPDADPTAILPVQIFRIERKSEATADAVTFELATPLDQEGRKLPNRQCLRDTCTHRYRRWNGAGFDYSQATCPFAGDTYFDAEGNSTSAQNDRCGKRLSDCRLRFGNNAPLPFRGFPGMNKYQVR